LFKIQKFDGRKFGVWKFGIRKNNVAPDFQPFLQIFVFTLNFGNKIPYDREAVESKPGVDSSVQKNSDYGQNSD
jgi:hypothetical protein